MAKKLRKTLCVVVCFFLILLGNALLENNKITLIIPKNVSAAEISAGEAVMEVSSGRMLFSCNENKKLPMASTTKILTAAIIIEDCSLDGIVEVPMEAAGTEGSSVYLKTGEKYTVRQLLYGLMLRSGNDCAVTLALYHSGSIEAFADAMNDRAKRWGAENSNFTNPHGLPDDEHYTTAHDLAAITCHAMKNDTFREIVSTKFFKEKGWQNKNKMLYSYDGADGVKTGYTVKAGRCLVTSAKRGNMQLICVVLNSPDMYERSADLLNQAFQKYTLQKLYSAEREFIVPTNVEGKTCILQSKKDFYYPLTTEERVVFKYELPKLIELPVCSGENKGKINIYHQNRLIFSENLCTIKDVDKSYADYLKDVARNF